jgi:hypothetical protein
MIMQAVMDFPFLTWNEQSEHTTAVTIVGSD